MRPCEEEKMPPSYTAIIRRDGEWWIGWIEEIAGVNSQGATREELIENLQSALQEAIEMNRQEAISAANGTYEEVSIST
jgi:predicted RNase H-like HicB family nuclease